MQLNITGTPTGINQFLISGIITEVFCGISVSLRRSYLHSSRSLTLFKFILK